MSEEMKGAELSDVVIHDEAPAAEVAQAAADKNAGMEGEVTPTESPAAAPLFTPPVDAPVESIDEVNLPFLSIKFQSGSEKNGINGVQVEDVIDVAVARLEYLNGKLACVENMEALTMLAAAKAQMISRTNKRVAQGVEGSNASHA